MKMQYVCKQCNKPYESEKKNSKFCCRQCRKEYNTIEYECDYCGKKFNIYRSRLKQLEDGEIQHIYCSRECVTKSQTKLVTKVCECCGKEYKIGYCFKDIQRFCSRDCFDTWRLLHSKTHIKKNCLCCGKEFITERTNQIFCSRECVHIYSRTKDSDIARYIRANSHGERNKYIQLKGGKCELTGSTENLVLHHIQGFNLILEEALAEMDVTPDESAYNYSEEFLKSVLKRFREIQSKYPCVVITESIHKLFHSEYGYGDNTEEQWNEFLIKHKEDFKQTA